MHGEWDPGGGAYLNIQIEKDIYIYIFIHRWLNVKYIGRYIDRAATLFCPCTKDYIFAPMDDDRPCWIRFAETKRIREDPDRLHWMSSKKFTIFATVYVCVFFFILNLESDCLTTYTHYQIQLQCLIYRRKAWTVWCVWQASTNKQTLLRKKHYPKNIVQWQWPKQRFVYLNWGTY